MSKKGETKVCSWCQESKNLSAFYSVSKKTGILRGQCKPCRKIITKLQRDPNWRPPCSICGKLLTRKATGGRRLCADCLQAKYDINEFRENGSRRLKLLPCKSCGGPKDRFVMGRYCGTCRLSWIGDNRDVGSELLNRARELYQKYGISLRQYEEMLKIGNGGCWICGNKPSNRSLAVDHAHDETKLVRGLLCHLCNRLRVGINTIESAKKVLNYLESKFDGRNL